MTAAPPVLDTSTQTLSYTQNAQQLEESATSTQLQDTNQYFALYTPGVAVNNNGGIHAYGVRTADTRVANDAIVELADSTGVGGASSDLRRRASPK